MRIARRALAAVVKPEEADEDDETDGEVLDEEELVNDSEEIVSKACGGHSGARPPLT